MPPPGRTQWLCWGEKAEVTLNDGLVRESSKKLPEFIGWGIIVIWWGMFAPSNFFHIFFGSDCQGINSVCCVSCLWVALEFLSCIIYTNSSDNDSSDNHDVALDTCCLDVHFRVYFWTWLMTFKKGEVWQKVLRVAIWNDCSCDTLTISLPSPQSVTFLGSMSWRLLMRNPLLLFYKKSRLMKDYKKSANIEQWNTCGCGWWFILIFFW